MSCQDPKCPLVDCQSTDDLPSYLGTYSLQSGVLFSSPALSYPLPGGGTYTLPPGAIVIPIPPNPTSASFPICYQGCISMFCLTVPSGASSAQILAIAGQVASEIGRQSSICNTPPPRSPRTFHNTQQTVTCGIDGGPQMKLIGALPAGVTFSIAGLTVAAGVFASSVSVADANSRAIDFLISLIDGGGRVECGWWNQPQTATCYDGSTRTVSANTYFSTVSQADANDQASGSASAQCPVPPSCLGLNPNIGDLTWTASYHTTGVDTFTHSYTASGNHLTGQITYPENDPSVGRAFLTLTSSSLCVDVPYDATFHLDFNVNQDGNIPLVANILIYLDGNVIFNCAGSAGVVDVVHNLTNGPHVISILLYTQSQFASGGSWGVYVNDLTITPVTPP